MELPNQITLTANRPGIRPFHPVSHPQPSTGAGERENERQLTVSSPTEWHHIRIKPTETILDRGHVETSWERLYHLDTEV